MASLEITRPFHPTITFVDASNEGTVSRTVRDENFAFDLVLAESGAETPPLGADGMAASVPIEVTVAGDTSVPLVAEGGGEAGSLTLEGPPTEIEPGGTATLSVTGTAPDRTSYRAVVTVEVGDGTFRQVVRTVLVITRSAPADDLTITATKPSNSILWLPSTTVDIDIRVTEKAGRNTAIRPPAVTVNIATDESPAGSGASGELLVEMNGMLTAAAAECTPTCDVPENGELRFVYRMNPAATGSYSGSVAVAGTNSARAEATIGEFSLKGNVLLAATVIGLGVLASFLLWRWARRRDRRVRSVLIATEADALRAMQQHPNWRDNLTVSWLLGQVALLQHANEFGTDDAAAATEAGVGHVRSIRTNLATFGVMVDYAPEVLLDAHRAVSNAAGLEAAAGVMESLVHQVKSFRRARARLRGRKEDPPAKTREQVTREIQIGDRWAYAVLLVVSTITGVIALWGANAAWGSIVDYMAAFVWGFGVTEGTKGIAGVAKQLNLHG